MNPHFFTAPFYFAFIWFRVQGSRGGFAAFQMTVSSYRQPSSRGEGAPKGRIGHRRYERERERVSQVRRL